MPRKSFATYLFGARAQLCFPGAPALAALAFAFALCAPSQAGAQPQRTRGAVTHTVRAHTDRARARKAACSTAHAKHGSQACSPAKGHRHKTKIEARHKHATGSHHILPRGKVRTPSAPGPGGSAATTCSEGVDATLNEEGNFACSSGAEPGCQEAFVPVVADDGSTLICEPEPSEAGGEEES